MSIRKNEFQKNGLFYKAKEIVATHLYSIRSGFSIIIEVLW